MRTFALIILLLQATTGLGQDDSPQNLYEFCKMNAGTSRYIMEVRQQGTEMLDFMEFENKRLNQIARPDSDEKFIDRLRNLRMKAIVSAYEHPVGKTKDEQQRIINIYEKNRMSKCLRSNSG